jgi:hypothetical protein
MENIVIGENDLPSTSAAQEHPSEPGPIQCDGEQSNQTNPASVQYGNLYDFHQPEVTVSQIVEFYKCDKAAIYPTSNVLSPLGGYAIYAIRDYIIHPASIALLESGICITVPPCYCAVLCTNGILPAVLTHTLMPFPATSKVYLHYKVFNNGLRIVNVKRGAIIAILKCIPHADPVLVDQTIYNN